MDRARDRVGWIILGGLIFESLVVYPFVTPTSIANANKQKDRTQKDTQLIFLRSIFPPNVNLGFAFHTQRASPISWVLAEMDRGSP
jgi:hypothetical protein